MGNHMHLPVTYVSRRAAHWFRKRFWSECTDCDYRCGPFRDESTARGARRVMAQYRCPTPRL